MFTYGCSFPHIRQNKIYELSHYLVTEFMVLRTMDNTSAGIFLSLHLGAPRGQKRLSLINAKANYHDLVRVYTLAAS